MLRLSRTPKGLLVTSDEFPDLKLGVTPDTRVGDVFAEVEGFLANVRDRHGAVKPDTAPADPGRQG